MSPEEYFFIWFPGLRVLGRSFNPRYSLLCFTLLFIFGVDLHSHSLQLSYAVPTCLPPSSAVFCHSPPSHTVPYQNKSQVIELVVLPDHGRPGNSRKRTGHILLTYILLGSWLSLNPALQGSRTTANTESGSEGVVKLPLGLDVNLDKVGNNC